MFKFLFLLCLQSVFAFNITEDIARIVRGYVEDLTPGEIIEKIELHYQLLGLMDDNGDWVHDYFKAFPNPAGLYLFPTSVTSLELTVGCSGLGITSIALSRGAATACQTGHAVSLLCQ